MHVNVVEELTVGAWATSVALNLLKRGSGSERLLNGKVSTMFIWLNFEGIVWLAFTKAVITYWLKL